MKYSTISIKPKAFGEEGFDVTQYDDPVERVASNGSLNAGLGFYHYPTKKNKNEAFAELKDEMIRVRKKLIEDVKNDILQLESLSL